MTVPVQLPTVSVGGGRFDKTALNILMPMHVQMDNTGLITHVGPTLAKLFRDNTNILGRPLLQFVRFIHPVGVYMFCDLTQHRGIPMVAQIKDVETIDLKAVVVQMPEQSGVLINFAFGTSLKQAVQEWDLNGSDFSPTDPTIEMLYVIEVQSALLEESKSLNNRLNGQWVEAEEKAYTDPLTGLSNRRALDRYITRLCRRSGVQNFSALLVDLDHFKSVNDTLGHAAGDKVLQEVADILLHETRPTDIVVRTGGDEFLLILENIQDKAQLKIIAERIIDKIERPISWDEQKCHVGASIGIVMCDTSAYRSVDLFLKAADDALYASKKNGRGRFQFAH